MSKLGCNCGHVIVDQEVKLPYKADVLPDESSEDFSMDFVTILKSFIQAKDNRQRDKWINENFTVPPYPADMPDQEMVWDLLHESFRNKTKTIYQCDACGRILIQRGHTDNFISFKPESDDWQGILRKVE